MERAISALMRGLYPMKMPCETIEKRTVQKAEIASPHRFAADWGQPACGVEMSDDREARA
jgi:hypothetical protein